MQLLKKKAVVQWVTYPLQSSLVSGRGDSWWTQFIFEQITLSGAAIRDSLFTSYSWSIQPEGLKQRSQTCSRCNFSCNLISHSDFKYSRVTFIFVTRKIIFVCIINNKWDGKKDSLLSKIKAELHIALFNFWNPTYCWLLLIFNQNLFYVSCELSLI